MNAAPAQPVDVDLDTARAALVIIDFRRDALPHRDAARSAAVVAGAASLLAAWRGQGGLVVFTHRATRLDVPPPLEPRPGEWVLDQPGHGLFWGTSLHDRLQGAGITQLVLAGLTTELCVLGAALEATDRGYACVVASDATAGQAPEFKRMALQLIAAQGGSVGSIACTADLIAAIDGDFSASDFAQLNSLRAAAEPAAMSSA